MNSKVLDTNFIQSLWSQSDSNHKKALEVANNINQDDEIIIPVIVVAELLASPSSNKIDVVEACKTICDHFELSISKDLKFISQAPYKLRKKLKANDMMLLAICDRYKADLVTFDKHLIKAKSELKI